MFLQPKCVLARVRPFYAFDGNVIYDAARGSTDANERQRPPRQRLCCVLGMLSSLEVKVLRPT